MMALSLLVIGGVAPPVRAASPSPARSPSFRIGLIGDTGYSPHDDANLLKVRASANRSGLAFVVHDGDVLKGDTPCSDGRLRYVKGVFDGFRTLVYTPGDNEWQDCPNGTQRGWLDDIRRTFFSTGNSLGVHPIGQWRQPATPDVPGPNGGGPAYDADGPWLEAAFDRAEAIRAPGVMIIMQDDPTDGSS